MTRERKGVRFVMVTIASLFDSQAEATKALDALNEKVSAEMDISVFEKPQEVGDREIVLAAVPYNQPASTSATAIPAAVSNLDLDDEEAAFFARGVEGGGVLAVVEVDEEHEESIRQVLQEQGGRTFTQD